MKQFMVIFVCTGNLCRSPLAEGILKNLILDNVDSCHIPLPIDVFSAGVYAEEGLPASRYAVETAAKHGIGLRFHRSRQLTAAAARSANLVLVMEKQHADYINHDLAVIENVHEIKRFGREGEYPPEQTGIMDPMGLGPEAYHRVFHELQEEITRISWILFPLVRGKYNAS